MRLEWTTRDLDAVYPGKGLKDYYSSKGSGAFPYYYVRKIYVPERTPDNPWVCFAYRNDDYDYWPRDLGYFDELQDALAAAQEDEDLCDPANGNQ